MRPLLLRAALALLRGVSPGPYGEALCGDLLEEFARTGATGRLSREIASALLRGLWQESWGWLQPVVFSAGWSLLYPAWQAMEGGRVGSLLAQRSYGMEWPYSSVALLASAGLSPLLYVWSGALLYMMRNQRGTRWGVRWFHVGRGLSLSLSVLLVSWMLLLRWTGSEGLAGQRAVEAGSVPGVHLSWLSLSLTVSLLVGTYPARPARPRLRAR